MSETQLSTDQAIKSAIQEIAVGPDRGRDISAALSQQVMRAILDGEADEVQAAVFLIAMRMKRESLAEFSGILTALQSVVEVQTVAVPELICLADPFDGFVRTQSMTPFIAPVLAACGVPSMQHGVESVGPKYGVTAHKVYRAAGMSVLATASSAAEQVQNHGWSYLDQSVYAPALHQLQSLRGRIVKRTALTTLERLLMPLRAERQTHLVLGYVHKAFPQVYASMAMECGYDSVVLIKGVEGGLAPALNKPMRRFIIDADRLHNVDEQKEIVDVSPILSDTDVAGPPMRDSSDPVVQCLETGLAVLRGESGHARESLCLAAGQILDSRDPTLSLSQAVEKVQVCLDNGSAKAHFDSLVHSCK
ncbi:hypothetical protein GCM10008090_14130 [Arenicella chitinivorans]|uniref:Anthranilate phosphoribosyltransferase n=1 Tax=Arenicella chitinivorans TaxID=1329800 RepID=A0A918VLG4_9GAMM|nr:hypothetical protein [Arenicella chitinivorans]GHA05687.1 hypothetical protein GCM10008090_14130 [Arenicella chitinivorans]